MDNHNRFSLIYEVIKKIPDFIGKKVVVEQLSDTTVFPWFIIFSKNFFNDYRKCKSNNWNYLISLHDFNHAGDVTKFYDENLACEQFYLIKKYNKRLFMFSKNKTNPWVVDDRENSRLILHKKIYLDLEKKLNTIITKELEKKRVIKKLTKKAIRAEKKRLAQLLTTLLKQEGVDKWNEEAIAHLDWNTFYNQFIILNALDLNDAATQKKIKKYFKDNSKKIPGFFLQKEDLVRIYSTVSIWERINQFIIKNKVIKFFCLLWTGFISHASLLNWVSFLFVFFSLSVYTCPIIFLMLGISLIGYWGIHFVFLIKKNPITLFQINREEADEVREIIKKEILNEEKNEYEFKLIHEIVFDLSKKKLNLNAFSKSILAIQKNFDPIYCPSFSIEQSTLFRYLFEVYPKTQFVASLTINLSGVVLYTYLLTWAIHSCFTVLGAIHLALIFSSPIATGLLILIFSSIFLMNHLFEFLSRETFYQRAILTRINEKCEYHYKDKYGKERVIQLEKWKKFEYLKDNISFLESEFKIFFKENNLIYAHNKFYDLFDTYLKKNIFKGGAPDKIPAESSTTTRIKKIVNRFFALSGGSFYGYSLSQQIIAQNKWGLHFFIQSCTFPFKLLFLPLIILNGFANLITYHLHHRQCNRFEMAKNLDNKLEILEQTNKKLLYLATLLSLEIKRLSTPIMKPVPLEKRLKTHLLKEMGHFSFFSEKLKTKTISEIKLPHIDVKVA